MDSRDQDEEEKEVEGMEMIDSTIQVRRVRDRTVREEELYDENFEEENDAEMNNLDEGEAEPRESQEFEEAPPWNYEEERDFDERYVSSELSESASVLTLYYSQPETLVTNEVTGREFPESSSEEEKTNREANAFRFTPAKNSAMERSRSAPPRSLTEIEEFKGSEEFLHFEKAAIDASELAFKSDGKLELDSVDGQNKCKAFLQDLEALASSLMIAPSKRKYRANFSQAYKVLYLEGKLCYLTEILDSAQEGFPYIIVNSEKYIFSPNVLRSGEKLFKAFVKLKEDVSDIYNNLSEDYFGKSVRGIVGELREELEHFDKLWTVFEKLYVFELMLIEKDARRHILKAIQLEQELKTFEIKERLKGKVVIRSPSYDQLRKKLLGICCELNSIANTAGKGRDDFTLEILLAAEDVSRRITDLKSRAVRKLADHIKSSFMTIRQLFRKYSENIEVIDPQLRNNTDLSEALFTFEKAWEKGKEFLLNGSLTTMIISFSQHLESLREKYPEVQEKIDAMDADIFMIIPCLAILKSLDDPKMNIYVFYRMEGEGGTEDENYREIRQRYEGLRSRCDRYWVYNLFEQAILEREYAPLLGSIEKDEVEKLVHDIKGAAILLQRTRPLEWNSFLETAMGII